MSKTETKPQQKEKYITVLLNKDANDSSTNKFFSYNLQGFTLKVGVPVEVPLEVYEACMKNSHLADRITAYNVVER